MYNFSFKGETLYRLIPSGGIDLFIPRIVLWVVTVSWDTGSLICSNFDYVNSVVSVNSDLEVKG